MLSGLTNFTPESVLTIYDNLEFLIRILLSCVLGVLIGYERAKRLKEAGVRTHCIVAVAAATFMILSKYCFSDLEIGTMGTRGADPARMAAQVVSGISFLGAGVIFKSNGSIKGLTTAAGMWATAAVGMAIGAGMYWIGLSAAAVLILVQFVFHRHPIGSDSFTMQNICVTMKNEPSVQQAFNAFLSDRAATIEESRVSKRDGQLLMELTIRLVNPIMHEDAMQLLDTYSDIYDISIGKL